MAACAGICDHEARRQGASVRSAGVRCHRGPPHWGGAGPKAVSAAGKLQVIVLLVLSFT